MIGYIYAIRNTINGKLYIGSTIDPQERHRRHWVELEKHDHDNEHLQNAWDKYGKDAFVFEIVKEEEFQNREELYSIEEKMLQGITKDTHYNVSKIAMGPPVRYGKDHHNFGKKWSQETNSKKGKAKWGIENPRFGKIVSEETRNRMSLAHKGKSNGSPSELTRKMISLSKTGKMMRADHPNSKPIIQLSLDGVFIKEYPCASEAQRQLGLPTVANICSCACGKLKTSAGFRWQYK